MTPLERATIDKETAIGIAKALAGTQVKWVPDVMINGKDGTNGADPLQALGLNMLMEIAQKKSK